MPFEIPTGFNHVGTFPALLEKVEEDSGQFGKMRKWHWLVDVEGEVKPFIQYTSANTGSRTISYQQLTALLGRSPQAGERIEDPTGSRCLLTFELNEKGYSKVIAAAPYTEPQQVLEGVPR